MPVGGLLGGAGASLDCRFGEGGGGQLQTDGQAVDKAGGYSVVGSDITPRRFVNRRSGAVSQSPERNGPTTTRAISRRSGR